MALTIQQTKQIQITDVLSYLGFEPQKIRHDECFYFAPYRTERTASFCVNIKKNMWHDFGTGEGGDLIDLIKLIINGSTSQALHHIENLMLINLSPAITLPKNKIPVLPLEENKIEIKKIKPLENRALVEYLESRCISLEIAKQFCKEIYYSIYSIGNKNYFGIAFSNVAGGVEVRSKYGKISFAPKDITFLPGSANDLFIYEGFFDFLSHQELFRLDGYTGKLPYADSIILNSVSNYDKSIGTIAQYSKVCVFLDNDDAGKKLIEKYNHLCADFGCICEDHSSLYAPHKDLNEFLISKATQLK